MKSLLIHFKKLKKSLHLILIRTTKWNKSDFENFEKVIKLDSLS